MYEKSGQIIIYKLDRLDIYTILKIIDNQSLLKVSEIFSSVQGEGRWAGIS